MNLADFEIHERKALPDALRVLLEDYPREGWTADPGYSDLIRFWLERHVMFRRLLDVMTSELEDTLNDRLERRVFAAHLSRYGQFFIQELHAHHTIEDQQYFPKLKTMDNRLEWGFDLLDRDHHAIDGHLNGFATDAKELLTMIGSDNDERPLLDAFEARLKKTNRILDRHLIDEEELIVPVILKHAPSGVV